MARKREKHFLYNGKQELEYEENPWHRYYLRDSQLAGATSVSGLLDKPALVSWAAKMACESIASELKPGMILDEVNLTKALSTAKTAHRTRSNQAAEIGTMVHDWLEQWVLSQIESAAYVTPDLPVARRVRSCVELMLGWFDKHVDQFIFAERKVLSLQNMAAGTADIGFITRDQRAAVADFKTGNTVQSSYGKTAGQIYHEIRIQTAFYVGALAEEGIIVDPKETDRYIFHIPQATGKFTPYNLAMESENYFSDWEADWDAFGHLRQVFKYLKGF